MRFELRRRRRVYEKCSFFLYAFLSLSPSALSLFWVTFSLSEMAVCECRGIERGERARWFWMRTVPSNLILWERRARAGRFGSFTRGFCVATKFSPPKREGTNEPENLKGERSGGFIQKEREREMILVSYKSDCGVSRENTHLFLLSVVFRHRTVQQKVSRVTVSATPSSINQIGFQTPPSTGEKPAWDAIIEVGGSQQFVSEGRYYECHSLPGVEPGSKVAFERVLATRDTEKPTFGQPYVKGARVEATVLENYKDEKVIVFKYKKKKHYRRKNGHRQHMTRFLVTKVIKA